MGEVILGMPGPWAEDHHELSDHYTTKIGGSPDWPMPETGIDRNLLNCRICGERLCLVAQVYAPVTTPKLMIEERVIYVLGCRMQKCGENPQSWRVLRVQKCNPEVESGSSDAGKMMAAEENPAPLSKIGSWWGNGFGGDDNDSDSDDDLQELSRAFSEAASVASHSKKSNGSRFCEPAKKLPTTKSDTNIPVMPCFYTYSLKETLSGGASTVCTNFSALSIKKSQSSSNQEDEEKWEEETYEYDKALGADRIYLKFKKRLDAYPEQCFRYLYGGNPLVASNKIGKLETCRLCGSLRHYEMQLMPPILYFLHKAADDTTAYSAEGWSWMTLIIYTCSKSCCPSQCEKKPGCCSWSVVEEAILIQNE